MKKISTSLLYIIGLIGLLAIAGCQKSSYSPELTRDTEEALDYPDIPDTEALKKALHQQKQDLAKKKPLASKAVIKVPDDYPTIQGAIDAAAPNAIIRISEGDYTERLTLLTDGVKLVGKGIVNLHGTINLISNDAEINRLNIIIDTDVPNGFIHGIHIIDSERVKIINNILSGGANSVFGIVLDNSSDCTIRKNGVDFTNQGGILLLESSNNLVTANRTNNHVASGITLWECTNEDIINNRSNFNNEHGILILANTTGNLIERNEFVGNTDFDIVICCPSAGGNTFIRNVFGTIDDGS